MTPAAGESSPTWPHLGSWLGERRWGSSVLPLNQLRQAGPVLIAEGSQRRGQHFEQLLRFAGASIGASRGGLIRKSFACVT